VRTVRRFERGPLRILSVAMAAASLLLPAWRVGAQGLPDDLAAACVQDLAQRLGSGVQPRVDGSWQATWPDVCLGISCDHSPQASEAVAGWVLLLAAGDGVFEYHAAAGMSPKYAGRYSEPPAYDFQDVVCPDTAFSGLRVTLTGTVGALREGLVMVEAPVQGRGDLARRSSRVLIHGPVEPYMASQVSATALTWGRVVGTFESRALRPVGQQFGRYGNYPYELRVTRFVPAEPPGIVAGCFWLDTLAARADELHLRTVVVRGSYLTHFEYDGLVPEPAHPADGTCWLAGDLSGIATPIQAFEQATVPVEVLGVFERSRHFTGHGGYGHLGTDRFQITVLRGHLVRSELSYADILANPGGFARAQVVVRGTLVSTTDGYALAASANDVPAHTCVLAGDLTWLDRFAGSFTPPCPVLVQGTLEARRDFTGTNGFGESRSRPLRLTATFIRPLWEEMGARAGVPGDPPR